jgi:polysaccharide export outer membrane protein
VAGALGVVVVLVSMFSGSVLTPLAVAVAQPVPEYVLAPGDTIEILVLGDSDLTRSAIIRPDGRINLPLVGDVLAAGLTTTQLAERLTQVLKAYLRSPQISVTVRTFQRASVYLLGQFTRPGTLEIQPGWTLMEAIASAGGVTGRAALTRATLIRRSTGQTINLDLERLLLRGDRSANMPLEPGDIVMVPMLQNRVLVLGGVRGPGAHDLDDGARVIDALARAGGPAAGAAANNIGVIRNGADGKAVVTRVDMTRIVRGDNTQNILVQDGDIVYVPEGPGVSWTNILFYLSGVGLLRGLLGR